MSWRGDYWAIMLHAPTGTASHPLAFVSGMVNRTKVEAIAQELATQYGHKLTLALHKHGSGPMGRKRNPRRDHRTLVGAGWAQAATYHVLSRRGAPLADLYVGPTWARKVAQVFTDAYGEPVQLIPHNAAADTFEDEIVAAGSRSNPAAPLVVGERRRLFPGGNVVTVLEVKGYKVRVHDSDRGTRDWMDAHDLASTSKPLPARGNPRGRELSVPEKHQLKIARDTLKMNEAMARVMGGPTHAEAREIILRLTGRAPNPRRRLTAADMRAIVDRMRTSYADNQLDDIAHHGERRQVRDAAKRELKRRGVVWSGAGVAERAMGRAPNPKRRNAGGPRIVYNRLLGGWYVVVGPHQTPLNGRFNSKAEAQAWLAGGRRANPSRSKGARSKRTRLLAGTNRKASRAAASGRFVKAGAYARSSAYRRGRSAARGGSAPAWENPVGDAFKPGDRVELHAATDEWMQGDRYGVVVGLGRTREYTDRFSPGGIVKARPVRVKLDKSGRVRRFHPDNLFLIEQNPHDGTIRWSEAPRTLADLATARVDYEGGRFLTGAILDMGKEERDRIEAYLVRIGHPSAFEPGTQVDRIAQAARELAAAPGRPTMSGQGRYWTKGRRTNPKRRSRNAGLPPTVGTFLAVLSSKLTQADQREERAERKRRIPVNIHRLAHYMGGVGSVRKAMAGLETSSAPADLERFVAAMHEVFIAEFAPIRQVTKQVRDYLERGTLPSLTRGGAARISNPAGGRTGRNPFGGPASEREQAEQMFRTWHEYDTTRTKRVNVAHTRMPKHVVQLGEVVRIDYISPKWEGKRVTYTHETKRPYPLLVSSPDAAQLYLVGGKMKPTADGLVN